MPKRPGKLPLKRVTTNGSRSSGSSRAWEVIIVTTLSLCSLLVFVVVVVVVLVVFGRCISVHRPIGQIANFLISVATDYLRVELELRNNIAAFN